MDLAGVAVDGAGRAQFVLAVDHVATLPGRLALRAVGEATQVHVGAEVPDFCGRRARRANLGSVLDDDEAVAGPGGGGWLAEGVVVQRVVGIGIGLGGLVHEDDAAVGDGAHGQEGARGPGRLDVHAVVPGQAAAERERALGRERVLQLRHGRGHRRVEPGGLVQIAHLGQERGTDDHGLRRPGAWR
jgi:hypothetical protein